jgi:hypothetical protein
MRRAATKFARAQAAVCHWFNLSIAHHSIASPKAIFRVLGSWPRQFQDNGLTAGATIVCVELKSTKKIERYRQQKK